jgi:hypothetical protein
MQKLAVPLLALSLLLVGTGPATPRVHPNAAPSPSAALVRAAQAVKATTTVQKRTARAQGRNIQVLAHHDLGGGGLNADVYSFRKFAYVGVWSGPCPATGVKVVDISKPRDPELVSVLQNPEGTSAEDVVVVKANTPSFRGDLAVTGIQACDIFSEVPRGLQFFDVSDPTNPTELGFWELPAPLIGCHEVDLAPAAGRRVLAACANPFGDSLGQEFLGQAQPEVFVVDASDPSNPATLGTFGGINNAEGEGCFPASFGHSVRLFDKARTLYASYWDAGLIQLDISDPTNPRHIGTVNTVPPDEDGDVHSMARGRAGLAFINPEDFSPIDEAAGFCAPGDWDGWGDLQIWDISDPANPTFVSQFATANAASKRTDGFFSIHNTEVLHGNLLAASWYSDGIRLIDISQPADPREVGSFVPPATPDPTGFFPPVPNVWGVWPHRGNIVLASDINSGLWILKVTG